MRIKGGKGFIQKQDIRVYCQGANERCPLTHPAGKLCGIVFAKFPQAVGAQQPLYFLLMQIRVLQMLYFQANADIVIDCAPIQQMVSLKHIADGALSIYGAASGGEQAGKNIQNGTFSAARWSQKRANLSLLQ